MLRQHLANDQSTNKEAEIATLSRQLQEAIQEAESAKESRSRSGRIGSRTNGSGS